jgi:hypothetical protein
VLLVSWRERVKPSKWLLLVPVWESHPSRQVVCPHYKCSLIESRTVGERTSCIVPVSQLQEPGFTDMNATVESAAPFPHEKLRRSAVLLCGPGDMPGGAILDPWRSESCAHVAS